FKALRSLEAMRPFRPEGLSREDIERLLRTPNENRLHLVVHAFEQGWGLADLHELTQIDPWFLDQVQQFAELARELRGTAFDTLPPDVLRRAKEYGFSDRRIAYLTGTNEDKVRARRHEQKLRPVFKRVDTCAAEFESFTPYLYSTYEDEDE